jgi:ribosomal protein S18 acetylase RimI-like enzyme
MVLPGSEEYRAASAVGFRPCPGERLFQRLLDERPIIRQETPSSFQLRNGTFEDLLKIQNQLSHVKEVAFQGWEILLIERQRGQSNRFFKVIEHNHSIVGVSIGGSHNARGTITHTWVAEGHRNHKLGQTLSDASLQALYDGGARIAHLMTTANNVLAEKFWERQGFVRETHHTFLEIDV